MIPFGFPAADEVQVWSCRLDALPPAVDRNALSSDEWARAARWHQAIDRERFVAGRAWLRHRLARCLDVAARAIRFEQGANGKPALAAAAPALHFNLSHSSDRALLAICLHRSVGADLEQVRPNPDCEAIARRHFTAGEFEQWLALEPERRLRGFYAGWTRKEAFVKALGGGLSIALDSFEIALDPDQPAALRSIGGSAAAAARWSMCSPDVAPGFAAAVAAEGAALRFNRLDDDT